MKTNRPIELPRSAPARPLILNDGVLASAKAVILQYGMLDDQCKRRKRGVASVAVEFIFSNAGMAKRGEQLLYEIHAGTEPNALTKEIHDLQGYGDQSFFGPDNSWQSSDVSFFFNDLTKKEPKITGGGNTGNVFTIKLIKDLPTYGSLMTDLKQAHLNLIQEINAKRSLSSMQRVAAGLKDLKHYLRQVPSIKYQTKKSQFPDPLVRVTANGASSQPNHLGGVSTESELAVRIWLQHFLNDWLTRWCRKIAAVIDPTCQNLMSACEMELVRLYDELFNRCGLQTCLLSDAGNIPQNQLAALGDSFLNHLAAQRIFLKAIVAPSDGTIASEAGKQADQFAPAPQIQITPNQAALASKASLPRYFLRKGHKTWSVICDGKKGEINNQGKAMNLIAYLLRNPPEEPIHATRLEAAVREIGNYGANEILVDETKLSKLGKWSDEEDCASGGGQFETIDRFAIVQEASGRQLNSGGNDILRRKLQELQATIEDENLSESLRREAEDELEKLDKSVINKVSDQSTKAVDRVRKALNRFCEELKFAELAPGIADDALRAFAAHVENYILKPSARYSNRGRKHTIARKAGCFTYEPPTGLIWVD